MNCRQYSLRAVAALAVTASFSLPLLAGGQSPVARPNIILILADDMGYSDLGCYGSGATYPDEHLGQRIHPPAGVSLVPAFANKVLDRDAIYFQHLGNRAVRAGKWKLVALKGKPWELYDLEVDRTETANLIGQYPEKAKVLAALWRAWATQVGAPI